MSKPKLQTDPSSPNSDHNIPASDGADPINRIPQPEAGETDNKAKQKPSASSNEGHPKIKSGGWFAKPPVRKDYIPPAPTSYPLKTPKDFHQTWPIDTSNGEGVVFVIDVTHPDVNEAKTYVVHPGVQAEAAQRCAQGDFTFGILTEKNLGYGGEVRWAELHPWVTKSGQFGLMPVKGPLTGSVLSEEAYYAKRSNIDGHQGKWVRRTSIDKQQVVIPLPDGADLGLPHWPKVLTDGDWETIITRAFDNRYIKSLDDKVARSLAGLE